MGANARGLLGLYAECFQPGNAIIEIGCGEASTPVLYRIAQDAQQFFYACDRFRPEIADLGQGNGDFIYINQSGEEFLSERFQETGRRISAACLDNFDWMWNPARFRTENKPAFLANMVKTYVEAGLVLNNVNSSLTHLRQSMLIEQFAADQCAILFDDTWFDYSHELYLAKGSSSVIYLLSKGWRVADDIDTPGLAVMMVKGILDDDLPRAVNMARRKKRRFTAEFKAEEHASEVGLERLS